MNKLHLAAGLALSAGSFLPMAYDASPAFADAQRTCVDAQGGAIDSTDLINTAEIQRAVGATVDGSFGPETCNKTWQALIQIGHLSGDGKTLKIGQKVHQWLNVAMPTESDRTPLIPSDNESDITAPPADACPKTVSTKAEISAACGAKALALIKGAGYYNVQAYQQANGISNYALQTATVGPKTYNWAMSGSKLDVTTSNMSEHVVVDISDQLAIFYKGGRAAVIARVSTGSGKQYTYTDSSGNQRTATATTRRGTNKIYREEGANHRSSDLGGAPGSMGYAEYFDGGIALHSGNTPGYPASHGCVRVDRGNASDSSDDALKLMRDKGLGKGDKVTVKD